MKNIIYFLLSLFVAIGAAFILRYWLSQYDDPGYVLIGFGHWSMETSLIVFLIGMIILFFISYVFFRLIGWLLRLPGKIKHKGRNIKFNRSQEALISGLVDSAEGNWEKAEKVLIKHATNSGAPLIHYLTAARAAQSRGAFKKRDEYLKMAEDQSPDSEFAIGLTQAELHLSENQFDNALQTLTRLQSIDSSHASVLKLLHQTYQNLGDWEGIRKLIPSLNKHKVMMEAEVKLLETETFSMLLKQAAEKGNANAIRELWQEIPEHIKAMQGIKAIYFAAMIEVEASAEIEEELSQALESDWNETFLVLYGSVHSSDVDAQIRKAEDWLALHPGEVVLLRVLGKLNVRRGNTQEAEKYLGKSIEVDPTVAAYQMLGDLFYQQGNKDRASECFKLGLELASSEVVHQAGEMSGQS